MPLTSLGCETLKEGSGRAVQQGDTISCNAIGNVLSEDGGLKQFWSTKEPKSSPFTFQAGFKNVIKGFDDGVVGMKLGEVRKISIPGSMGYGPKGFPAWSIPPNADLQFEIEVLSIV